MLSGRVALVVYFPSLVVIGIEKNGFLPEIHTNPKISTPGSS